MDATRLDFRPFRSWRYDTGRVKLDEVIAPPYDVISPAQREELYAKSPFNVIRLILGKEPNFYENAGDAWKKWAQEGILIQDKRPAVYLYEQTFKHPWNSRPLSRLAVVGALKLEDSGAVLRHEATFDAPKRDRFQLLEKTKTNLSPIFGLYPHSQKLGGLFSAFQKKPPLFQTHDGEGVFHQGWAIQEELDQQLICETLASEKILIADGHHRYETALAYRKQMRVQSGNPSGEQPFDFVMMALVAEDDPGLLVLPTHRIIRTLETCTGEEFFKRLGEYFDFLPCPDEKISPSLSAGPNHGKIFGAVFQKKGGFIASLKNPAEARKNLPPGKPPLWYKVEANLLNFLVFDCLWGLSAEKRQRLVEYTQSSEKAIQTVRGGKAECAFLLPSSEVDTMRQLAYSGEQMPQKTTYFYPKLASGLFFYHHGH